MIQKALQTIYNCITPYGIIASSQDVGNYARVWSRDAMMTGIVGLIINDQQIIKAHKISILTLANQQSDIGQIPSNVKIENENIDVSFGTLVGRVDATTWWLIGTLSYIKITNDKELFNTLEEKLIKSFSLLQYWEFNNKGFIYTPLGGNWADEYICEGYTIYDNSLRLWAIQLATTMFDNDELKKNFSLHSFKLKKLIVNNFNINNSSEERYHFNAYQQLIKSDLEYLPSALNANGYFKKWDMAGNAIAMLLGLNNNVERTTKYLHSLHKAIQHWMLPVFYPIIQPQSNEWHLLENNYNYQFKNTPYNFQNGGSWPVFLGWLCIALAKNNETDIPNNILNDYQKILQSHSEISFYEYINTQSLEPKGTNYLCFSAIGFLLMNVATNKQFENLNKLL